LTTDTQFSSNRATGVGIRQTVANGFNVGAAVSSNVDTKDATADVKTGTGYTLNADYANGPLSLAAATQKTKTTLLAVAEIANANAALGSTCTKAVAVSDKDTTTSIIAASYDLGMAKLFAQFGTVKTDDNGVASSIVVGEGKRTAQTFGLQVPMGNVTLAASVSGGSKTESFKAANAGEKRDFTGYGVGARYALSKRTMAYVNYGSSTLKAGSNTTNFGSEVKNTEAAIGLAHNF
jgi:predicted porin